MAQILFIIFTFILLLAVLWLFLRKADLQLMYMRKKQGKKSDTGDFIKFSWTDTKARSERWQAFLLFPMLFPIELDEEKEELLGIKRNVKRIHIGIYLIIIILIIMGIYSEKVFV